MKEVVLDDTDVARAILEYISKNFLGSIAVGASTRNALTRFVNLCQKTVVGSHS